MISGSYPPMPDGVGDYTQTLFFRLKETLKSNITLITTRTRQSHQEGDYNVMGEITTWDTKSVIKIIRKLKRLNPDIVHIQYPAIRYGRHPAVNMLPLLLRIVTPKIRVISTFHEFSNRTLKGKLRLMMSAIFTHRAIIVERHYKSDMKRMWPPISRKLTYVPVGSNIKPENLSEHDRQLHMKDMGLSPDEHIIVYFGTIKPKKGIELLLNTFNTIHHQIPKTKLFLLGHLDEEFYNNYLHDHIERMKNPDSVILTGSLDARAISHILQLADVCVLPFPDGVSGKRGSFMAAMYHRLPIVTTRPQVPFDGLIDGENVLLVPYGDQEELAQQLKSLLEDSSLRERLRSGIDELVQVYSWEQIRDKTLEEYRNLLSND